jgi:O-antigen ligase/polysaccharide polymerase Wzy-like membrane protein
VLFGSSLSHVRWASTEAALAVALPATIFAFAMGSGSVSELVRIGLTLRWVFLVLLAGIAIAFGWSNRDQLPRALVAVAGGLGLVGLLSAAWSVRPAITAERATSFLIVATIAAFAAVGVAHSRSRLELLLSSLLAGPVIVALAGLVVLATDHSLAVQSAGGGMPARLQGFSQNPDTAAMLFALVLPISIYRQTTARTNRARIATATVTVLLYGSVLASGSRGSILASAVATLAFLVVRVSRLRVLIPTGALLIVFFGVSYAVAGARSSPPAHVPRPQSTVSVARIVPAAKTVARPTPAGIPSTSWWQIALVPVVPARSTPLPFVPEKDEIGYPGIYEYKSILSTGSGRVYAWISAITQGLQRPLLGYGFGTEQYVFVDRFYVFDGGYTENSFVGMFLQLGILGTLLLLAPFLLVARVVARRWRIQASDQRSIVALGGGVIGAGFVLALFQSYLYSVGNIATLSFWILAFVVVVSAWRYDPTRPPA